MDKELSNIQWAALVLLMVGCGTSQIPTNASGSNLFAIPLPGNLWENGFSKMKE